MKSERDILINLISAADQMYRGFTVGDGFIFTTSDHWKNSNQPQFILDKLRDALDDGHEFAKSNKINIKEFKGDWKQVGRSEQNNDMSIGTPAMKGRRWTIDPYGSGKDFPKINHKEKVLNEGRINMKYKEFFKEELHEALKLEIPVECPCGCTPEDTCDTSDECMCECSTCGCGKRDKDHTIEEKKWIQTGTHVFQKGLFSGKKESDLNEMKANLKKKNASHKEKGEAVPHKNRVAMSQINFALRSKNHKLNEDAQGDQEQLGKINQNLGWTGNKLKESEHPTVPTCKYCFEPLLQGKCPFCDFEGGVDENHKQWTNKTGEYIGKYPSAIKGEDLYVDYDEDSKLWCVFGTESGHAYTSNASEDGAKQEMDRINQELGGTD